MLCWLSSPCNPTSLYPWGSSDFKPEDLSGGPKWIDLSPYSYGDFRLFTVLNRANRLVAIASGLCVFALIPGWLVAQVSTTSLRGVVADSTGAVIGGAQLTLVNSAAGLVPRHFKSNEAEFYAQDSWHATRNLQLTRRVGIKWRRIRV